MKKMILKTKEHCYLYFPGCKIQPFLPEYDRDTRSVLSALDVFLDDTELNCCGYPVRQMDFTAAVLSSARILATAAGKGLPILTPCKCCYGNLKMADFWMRENDDLRQKINNLLKDEGLAWIDGVVVRHLLTALTADVTLERLEEAVTVALKGIRLAAHYGCHALRPGDVTQFDNPMAPTIFESILEATGVDAVQWPLRLECCGRPLWEIQKGLSVSLMVRKLEDAHESGAQGIVTACTYCQLQFSEGRGDLAEDAPAHMHLPAILISKLLAVAMGLLPESDIRKALRLQE